MNKRCLRKSQVSNAAIKRRLTNRRDLCPRPFQSPNVEFLTCVWPGISQPWANSPHPFLRNHLGCWQQTACEAKHILFSTDRVIYKSPCLKAISFAHYIFHAPSGICFGSYRAVSRMAVGSPAGIHSLLTAIGSLPASADVI